MLTKVIMGIILQYTSNYYVAHLKLIQCYMSLISQFFKKRKEKEREGANGDKVKNTKGGIILTSQLFS